MDGQCHPIVDALNNYNIHPIVDGQCHLLMEVYDGHPNVDGQCHPFLDVY